MARLVPYDPAHALVLRLQISQRISAGMDVADMTEGEAFELGEAGPAWSVLGADDFVLACFGLATMFCNAAGVPVQAHGWAMLAEGMAPHERLAVTRHARACIANSGLRRIESLCRTEVEIRWLCMLGYDVCARLPNYGAKSETHWMMERLGS